MDGLDSPSIENSTLKKLYKFRKYAKNVNC